MSRVEARGVTGIRLGRSRTTSPWCHYEGAPYRPMNTEGVVQRQAADELPHCLHADGGLGLRVVVEFTQLLGRPTTTSHPGRPLFGIQPRRQLENAETTVQSRGGLGLGTVLMYGDRHYLTVESPTEDIHAGSLRITYHLMGRLHHMVNITR